jgi:hypothetical protein
MSGFVCPGCRHTNDIFRATTGGARALAAEVGVPFLGAVPLDPRISVACDAGESFFDTFARSPASDAFMGVVRNLARELGEPAPRLENMPGGE